MTAALEPVERLHASSLEAEAQACQDALSRDPDNPALLHRLGRLIGRLGQPDLELALLGQAVARDGGNPDWRADFGLALLTAGHPEDARAELEEAVRLRPGHGDAAGGLADLAIDRGDHPAARALIERGGGRRVHRVEGRLASHEGRWNDAVEHYLVHLATSPLDTAVLFYLGVALQAQDLLEPAIAAYRQALSIDPDLFEAHANLVTVLTAAGRAGEALSHADRAVALAPSRPGTYLNRSNARREAGDWHGAAADLEHAVGLAPDYAEAWSTFGNLHHDLGETALALAAHAKAVALAPALAQAHWNRSFTLLASGRLGEGWDEYEWRRSTVAARPEPRDFPWPVWHGEPLVGQRILVWREQGIGDELLFLTCLGDLVAAGARVTLLASPRLVSLLTRSFPGVDVRPDDPAVLGAIGEFDFQSGLASLPRWLRRSVRQFPESGAFLVPDQAQVAKWSGRLAALPDGLKIGLCWRSGLMTPERQRHYAPLDRFRGLLQSPGLVWINLQYDDCGDEIDRMEKEWGVTVHRWDGEDLRDDLESVIGLLAALDGVVTAPTAVSSFAGAAGRPTWQLDSGSDWTVFGRDRSPWFPTIRVISKKPASPDWEGVLEKARKSVLGLKVFEGGAET